ncbi:MAG: 2-hydroxyacid dehydrogenase [Alphaproteobacteria bacterium]
MPDPAARPTILLTRKLPDAVERRAARDYDARLNGDDLALDPPALARAAEGCAGLLVCAVDKVGAETIGLLPDGVKIIATFSVGTDHIDLAAAKRRGIIVTNTPDVLTDATADIALLLMLAAARRAGEGERMIRANGWTGWTPTQLLGTHMTGKTLGIVGMGRIGQAVARRARAFDMRVRYSNPKRLAPGEEDGAIFHPTVEDLLPHAEFLSVHCPLTPETRHLIDARRIALLPKGAILVNTARGPVLDDAAVVAGLRSGQIAAAGLDVYDGEPAVPPDYVALDNVVLLPHLGSATTETRVAMGNRALDNLDAYFAGRSPADRVA